MKFVLTIEAENTETFNRALEHAVLMARAAPKEYIDTSYRIIVRSDYTWSTIAPDYRVTVERQA